MFFLPSIPTVFNVVSSKFNTLRIFSLNDLGFPDIGLTTLQDVSTRSYLISRVTNLPTIVDIDTGFKSCKETIETFEEFGVAAVHLEDQIEQKRCGHLDNKELISKEAGDEDGDLEGSIDGGEAVTARQRVPL